MRLALLCTCVAMSSACGISLSQPDGGRLRLNCTNAPVTVPVRVLDLAGAPMEGATVLATNVTDGRHASGATSSSGVYAVSEELGPGVVKVGATFNDLATSEGNFTFTCGECDCAVSPRQLTLQLR